MLNVVLQTAQSVLGIYIVGFLGFFLTKIGFIGFETKKIIPKLVTAVALPPFLFLAVTRSFTQEKLLSLFHGTLIPIISILAVYSIGLFYAYLFKVPRTKRGVISVGAAASNTIFIGLPVNLALFGEQALPYVLLYFFANTTFFWTLGNYTLSLDGANPPNEFNFWITLRAFFSPPFLGFLAGLFFVLFHLTPPAPIEMACSMVGGLTSPLALLFIGISLVGVSLKALKPDRDLLMTLAGRFILSPLAVYLLSQTLIPVPALMLKVFIIQSSLPAAANLALMSSYHGGDASFAAIVVSVSTVLSLVSLPIFMLLFAYLNL
jgi:predicted permease